ncbi:MAG TPA: cell division protein ZapE [Pseudomonadales bacterium]|nr:cell division protein ZapE [Pseudomonadales bacterium]
MPQHPTVSHLDNANTPINAYRNALRLSGFHPDDAQEKAALMLNQCHASLQDSSVRAIKGVYLWGPVGRGKTWLLDAFFQCLNVPAKRQHFHHFMRWVHRRLFELTGTPDPLLALAHELADEVRVLCFDELFVSDIGDAILLGGLFQVLFDNGVVMVTTSNQPPQQLYANGFNRQRFLPTIAAIEEHMHIVAVDGGQDHRLHPGAQQTRYWCTPLGQPSKLETVFQDLTQQQTINSGEWQLNDRRIATVKYADRVLWCRFADLCGKPLSALDFIQLCDQFSALLISEIPQLGGEQREGVIARGTEDGVELVKAGDRLLPSLSKNDDSVRRFIALVDECYDRRIPLYLEAEVPLDELYLQGFLEFPFRRTLSRLKEMQLRRFGAL